MWVGGNDFACSFSVIPLSFPPFSCSVVHVLCFAVVKVRHLVDIIGGIVELVAYAVLVCYASRSFVATLVGVFYYVILVHLGYGRPTGRSDDSVTTVGILAGLHSVAYVCHVHTHTSA